MPTRNLWRAIAFALCVTLLSSSYVVLGATIETELWVYNNGDTVTVMGADFGPTEIVDVVTSDPEGNLVDAGQATTGTNGGFSYSFVLNTEATGLFDVVATGETSGLTAATQ